MGILAVHITTAKIRESPVIEVALGHLGHPRQIGVGWVPQNDVTMEAVRADDYFPLPPVCLTRSTASGTLLELPPGFPHLTASLFRLCTERIKITSTAGQNKTNTRCMLLGVRTTQQGTKSQKKRFKTRSMGIQFT